MSRARTCSWCSPVGLLLPDLICAMSTSTCAATRPTQARASVSAQPRRACGRRQAEDQGESAGRGVRAARTSSALRLRAPRLRSACSSSPSVMCPSRSRSTESNMSRMPCSSRGGMSDAHTCNACAAAARLPPLRVRHTRAARAPQPLGPLRPRAASAAHPERVLVELGHCGVGAQAHQQLWRVGLLARLLHVLAHPRVQQHLRDGIGRKVEANTLGVARALLPRGAPALPREPARRGRRARTCSAVRRRRGLRESIPRMRSRAEGLIFCQQPDLRSRGADRMRSSTCNRTRGGGGGGPHSRVHGVGHVCAHSSLVASSSGEGRGMWRAASSPLLR